MFLAQQPQLGQGLLIHEVSRSHTTTHHSRQDSSGRVISSSQRPLPTQQSQQTDILAPGGIRTHSLSRRAAADLRLRPHGHCDRHFVCRQYNFKAETPFFARIMFHFVASITIHASSARVCKDGTAVRLINLKFTSAGRNNHTAWA